MCHNIIKLSRDIKLTTRTEFIVAIYESHVIITQLRTYLSKCQLKAGMIGRTVLTYV